MALLSSATDGLGPFTAQPPWASYACEAVRLLFCEVLVGDLGLAPPVEVNLREAPVLVFELPHAAEF